MIDGAKHNSIAFLDCSSSNPFAITNKSENLLFSSMPPLSDQKSNPKTLMSINANGTVAIEGGPHWSLYNYGAGFIVKGSRNNSIGIFDSKALNPIAITNQGGNLLFSSMPPLGDKITKPIPLMSIKGDRNVSIFGKFEAKEILVTTTPTADFVFEKEYNLESLDNVEEYINENKHLKGIQSASEMKEEGLNISEFQIQLLQKIEEMTLYLIEQNKKLKEQDIKMGKLKTEIMQLKVSAK